MAAPFFIPQAIAELRTLPRPYLDAIVDALLEEADRRDGDPDLEANSDELDGTGGEDDFISQGGRVGI